MLIFIASRSSKIKMAQFESFLYGIIAALGALFVQIGIYVAASFYFGNNFSISFANLFLIPGFLVLAAFTEETFKYLVISKKIDELSFEKTYVVNSLLVGIGFALTEFLLFMSSGNLPSTKILGEIFLLHVGTSGIIGYLVGTNNPKKIATFIYVAFIATFFHAGYNLLIQNRAVVENYLIFGILGFLILANLFNFSRISRKLAQQ